MRQLCKGNVAVVKGAVLAGCKAYYGYPITPASEIAEAAAEYFPQVGGTFLQAESEVAAINMVYGAASAGQRVMTASSGPGLSLTQEGLSYLAGSELPCGGGCCARRARAGQYCTGAKRLFLCCERRRPREL
jgi:2-oxoisovalerate ferredoxin oxidoreductase alpha subunit